MMLDLAIENSYMEKQGTRSQARCLAQMIWGSWLIFASNQPTIISAKTLITAFFCCK